MGKDKELSFEEGLERFREIVETLERGTATLAETLRLYEEAVGLAAALNAELARAEVKVEELAGSLASPLPEDTGEDEDVPPPDSEYGEGYSDDDGDSLF